MLNRLKSQRYWLVSLPVVLALLAGGTLLCSGDALAKPPDHAKGNGNGGGGGNDGGGDDDDGGDNAAAYALTDLGSSTPFGFSQATAVSDFNADGIAFVVGDAWNGVADQPFVWEVDATGNVLNASSIPLLSGAESSFATAANSAGILVGQTSRSGEQDADGDWVFPGFVSIPGYAVAELPSISGKRISFPVGINEFGDIVGAAHVANDPVLGTIHHGAFWHADAITGAISGPIDLGEFYAYDINADGVMAGEDSAVDEAAIAWFDQNNELQTMYLGIAGRAVAINNLGDVAGTFREPDGSEHVFLWTPDTGIVNLGEGIACDINGAGNIVGESWDSSKQTFVALWSDGTLFDTNDLIDAKDVHLLHCGNGINGGINNSGHIVGLGRFGKRRDNEDHGFLLTPTAP